MTQSLVTVFGGSGFLGRYVVRRLAKRGWRVRVAVRRPDEAGFLRPYGHVGQVEPIFCNIRDDASVRAALQGAEACVNCVGTFDATGRNAFDAVHVEGAGRIARIAPRRACARFVQVSAIGADAGSASRYAASKAEGEAAVLAALPRRGDPAALDPVRGRGLLLQPLRRHGRARPGDPAGRRRHPVPAGLGGRRGRGGRPRRTGEAAPGVYELGGPETLTFRELMERMLHEIRRRRLVVGLPFWAGRLIGRCRASAPRSPAGSRRSPSPATRSARCAPTTSWPRARGASPSSASRRRRWPRCCPTTSGASGPRASTPPSRNRRRTCAPDGRTP